MRPVTCLSSALRRAKCQARWQHAGPDFVQSAASTQWGHCSGLRLVARLQHHTATLTPACIHTNTWMHTLFEQT